MSRSHECEICKQLNLTGTKAQAGIIFISAHDFKPFHSYLKEKYPRLQEKEGYICSRHYAEEAFKKESDVLTTMQEEVLHSIEHQKLMTEDVADRVRDEMRFSDKLADSIAFFGGSWAFIIIAVMLMLSWIWFNKNHLVHFDPFPFILLNLFLTCVSALQAPFIMMSQNRQIERDRITLKHSYKVNLKAELEIRQLGVRLETFMNHYLEKMHELHRLHEELTNTLKNK